MRDETNDRDESSRVDFGAEGGRRIWAGGGRTVGAEGGAGDLRELLARLDVLDHGLVESGEVLVPVLRRCGGGRGSGAGPRGARSSKRAKKSARVARRRSRRSRRRDATASRDISAKTIARVRRHPRARRRRSATRRRPARGGARSSRRLDRRASCFFESPWANGGARARDPRLEAHLEHGLESIGHARHLAGVSTFVSDARSRGGGSGDRTDPSRVEVRQGDRSAAQL